MKLCMPLNVVEFAALKGLYCNEGELFIWRNLKVELRTLVSTTCLVLFYSMKLSRHFAQNMSS